MPERPRTDRVGLIAATALAAGAGGLFGVVDVALVHGPVFTSAPVFFSTAALAAAVQAAFAITGALIALPAGRAVGALLHRPLPAFGSTLAGGLVTSPAIMALEQAHRATEATVTSAAGWLITAAVTAAAAVAWLVLCRPLQRLSHLPRGVAAGTAALVLVAAVAGWRPETPRHPRADDIVFISIDSVRADDWERSASARPDPALQGFLDGALIFSAARTTWSHSLPSHASVLTGRWPVHHGARIVTRTPRPGPWQVEGSPLRPDVPTLAERLVDAGYQTGVFYDNAWPGFRAPGHGAE